MTNQSINEAVARKVGWTINKTQDYQPWYWPPNSWPDSNGVRELPNYCTDILAAWEIVEKPGISWQLMKRSDDSWFAALSTNTQAVDYREATADTAPMAICLAFLKLGKK